MRLPIKIIILALAGMMIFSTQAKADALADAQTALNNHDYETAESLFRPLAEQGNSTAQVGLGNMYFAGLGVREDLEQATKWFRLAAENGDSGGQVRLAYMLILQNKHSQAITWYKKAAMQSEPGSQAILAHLHYAGKGVPIDIKRSYMWASLSIDNGFGDLIDFRDEVASQLSRSDLIAAKNMAQTCQDSGYQDC